jgi:hypothetical protein
MINTSVDGAAREMSRYISIEDYDAYEEQHPFYKEMAAVMQRTIGEAFARWCASGRARGDRFRILELGAGTGLFTKSLAVAFPTASIVAVEVDGVCAAVLNDKMRGHPNVRCDTADSTTYRDQTVHVVVTSFADHHIADADKGAYFTNIRANLVDEGLFVSGEEFLPDYDEDDNAARDVSILAYHRCILGLMANLPDRKARAILTELETAAMQSGLERHGDFKISAAVYRRLVAESGFDCAQTKLGPLDVEGVGGVFVNTMTKVA